MDGRILLVEDNALNLELALAILEIEGFEVRVAEDAAACWALLAEWRPDMILMDVQLPDTDGLTLTRALRATPATRDMVIVALTAHAMPEDEQRALAAGCNGFLTKPVNPDLLPGQVAAFLAGRKI